MSDSCDQIVNKKAEGRREDPDEKEGSDWRQISAVCSGALCFFIFVIYSYYSSDFLIQNLIRILFQLYINTMYNLKGLPEKFVKLKNGILMNSSNRKH